MQAGVPEKLGRYELVAELARGSTTIAYRARDPELDRAVVVKLLALPDDVPASQRTARAEHFLEAARRVATVAHPSLVVIHDCGWDEATGRPFVVQELVAGRTLSEALVPGVPGPRDEALRLASTLGRALQQLHAAGLVHGAVRPGNVLVAEGRPPKLADAGLVAFDGSRPQLADVREALAESLYFSPEQAVGERVDARSDIFALGAVAYLLVTGRNAFEAETAQQVLARVSHDRPLPPSQIVPDLPPGLDDVLGQALAMARKDRYADIAAFCDDLEEILVGRPPRHARRGASREETGQFREASARPADAESNVTGAMLKRRRSVARVAAAVTALALVAGLELLRRELEAPDAAPAGRPTVDLEPREGLQAESEGLELPSLASTETAKLSLEFQHTLESGTLVVTVDGSKVLERRVTAAIKRSLLGIKLREGRVRELIEVPAGRHEVAVRVSWGNDQRSERVSGVFTAGATRRLSARVARIGKRLSVEWE